MENLFEREIIVTKINHVMTVPYGKGETEHRGRLFHGIVFELTGVKEYQFIGGRKITINPGEILYLPRYSDYDVSYRKPSDCIAINFLVTEDGHFAPFAVAAKPTKQAEELFQKADSVWNAKKQGYQLKTASILYDILHLTYQSLNSEYLPQKAVERLAKASGYIENNYYKESMRISTLAEMSGMSAEYFRRQFRAVYGISPLKHINNLRISRAKELLESNMYAVKEIAFMCGFEDESYFSHEFKRAVECTPRVYKNRKKQK